MSCDFIIKSKEISEAVKEKFLCTNAKEFYGFDSLKEAVPYPNML
jgi:hypothetical protein